MKNKSLIVGVTALLIAFGFIMGKKFFLDKENERLGFLAHSDLGRFVPQHAMKLGPDKAKVTLVEFLDPECESCREMYPIVKEILKEYDGKIQLVVRYAPFHRNSEFAVSILEAAKKQGKYWETLSLLFQSQPYWGNHHDPKPELIWTYLPSIGLDVEKIRSDMASPEITNIIATDREDGKYLGVRGTPTFFVNGEKPAEFGPEALRSAIESALKN